MASPKSIQSSQNYVGASFIPMKHMFMEGYLLWLDNSWELNLNKLQKLKDMCAWDMRSHVCNLHTVAIPRC